MGWVGGARGDVKGGGTGERRKQVAICDFVYHHSRLQEILRNDRFLCVAVPTDTPTPLAFNKEGACLDRRECEGVWGCVWRVGKGFA